MFTTRALRELASCEKVPCAAREARQAAETWPLARSWALGCCPPHAALRAEPSADQGDLHEPRKQAAPFVRTPAGWAGTGDSVLVWDVPAQAAPQGDGLR